MPKTRVSNDRGLVQTSGDGFQIVAKNGSPTGLHFKTIKVDFKNLTGSNTDDAVIKDLGTLPAESSILFNSVVCTELTSGVTGQQVKLVHAASGKLPGHTASGTEILGNIATGLTTDTLLNHGSGSFRSAVLNVGTANTLYLVEDTQAGQEETFASGSLTFTLGYVGTES